ncbi:MAG: 16S rRNA processing protein RimM, partial [Firmicutes bacterium]|nr:16S rRNA processing protein RimM [Bacillota bacterium]
MGEEYITVGEVVGTHGHRGAVRLVPHTDFPDRFAELNEIAVLLGGRRTFFGVEGAFVHGRVVVLKLRGVDSLEEARRLRGGLLQITRDRLRPLPPGHYYLFQIVG